VGREAAVLDEILGPWRRNDAPGLVAGVLLDGEVLYRGCVGLASIEHGTPNTPATRLRIASITKHMTCIAVLMLARTGHLDPDAGIRRYVPELPPLEPDPTLRQLMNNAGGLRCPVDLSLLSNGITPMPRGANFDYLLRQRSTNFAAGERMLYCNGGYQLLSLAVERASDLPFGEFLRRHLFEPLGMHDTLLWPSDLDLLPGIATLHHRMPDGSYRRGIYSWESLGEGGVVSTLDDMLRWMAGIRSKRLSGGPWHEALQEFPRYAGGVIGSYGYGLIAGKHRGLDTLYHGGAQVGTASQMLSIPSRGLDVIVVTNRSDVPASELAKQIADALLGSDLPPAPKPMPTDQVQALLGRYHSPSGLACSVVEQGGLLAFTEFVGAPGRLLFRDDDGVLSQDVGLGLLRLLPGPATGGRVESIEVRGNGPPEHFVRLADSALCARDLAARLAAEYYCADLDAYAYVRPDGEQLLLDLRGRHGCISYRLDPLSPKLLSLTPHLCWLPVIYGTVILEDSGAMVVNTARSRGLRFEPCS
jgi:D-aminopeptidase